MTTAPWRLAPLLGLTLLLPPLPAPAAPAPDPGTAALLARHEEDLRLLYNEAAVIGAETYLFYLYMSGDEAKARALEVQVSTDPQPRQALSRALQLAPRQLRAYAAPLPLREQLRRLKPGEVSPLFQPLKGQWALVELKAVDAAQPLPSFAALRDSLMRLAGTNALPDPATLRAAGTPVPVAAAVITGAALPAGVDVNAPHISGHTLLQRALREGNVALATELLARGADPNRCLLDVCPLQLALRRPTQAAALVGLLLEQGAEPDRLPPGLPEPSTVLADACQQGQLDVVRLLLEKGADPDAPASAQKPMAIALAQGNAALLRLLLDHGADPDGKRSETSPLHTALAAGQRELAELLLARGADPLARRPVPGRQETAAPLVAALAAGKPELAAWFRRAVLQKLAADPAYRWSGWIEQQVLAPPSKDPNAPLVNIIRTPLKPGSRILLNRDSFTLNVRLPAKAALLLEATNGRQLFQELATFSPTAPLLSRSRRQDGRKGPLLIGDSRARAASPARVGGVLQLNPGTADFDYIEKTPEGPVYVRTINRLTLDKGSGGSAESSVEQPGLREIALVLGAGVDYSDTLGDLVNPQTVTLVFR